jgi:hypothetical protein
MPQQDSLQIALDRFSHSARQLYDHWLAAFQFGVEGSFLSQAEQQYHRNVDAAERVVEQSLELQGRWLKFGREVAEAATASQPALSPYEQPLQWCEQMLQQRREAWQQCFATARQLDFKVAEQALQSAGNQTVLSAWNDMSQQALEQLRAILPQPSAGEAAEPKQAEAATAPKGRAGQGKRPQRGSLIAAKRQG